MSDRYFLFASPQGFKRSSSSDPVSAEELRIEVQGNKAYYNHNGKDWSVALSAKALEDDEAVVRAVNTHIKARMAEFQGHGPVDYHHDDSHDDESDRPSHTESGWSTSDGQDDKNDFERIRAFVVTCTTEQCRQHVSHELGPVFGELNDIKRRMSDLCKENEDLRLRLDQAISSINSLNGIIQSLLSINVRVDNGMMMV